MFLLDTNVISELRKTKPHGSVVAWRRSVPVHQLAIPAVVIGEIQVGIEITRKQDMGKAIEIENWLEQLIAYYTILPIDGEIFREWARLTAGKSGDLDRDALIGAAARVHNLTVVTRNVRDFAGFGVRLLNPFANPSKENL